MRVFYQIFVDNKYFDENHCLTVDSKRMPHINFMQVFSQLLNELVTRFRFEEFSADEKQIRVLLVPWNDYPRTLTLEIKVNIDFIQISVDFEPEYLRLKKILQAVIIAIIHRMKYLDEKEKLEYHKIVEKMIGGNSVEDTKQQD